MLYTTWSKIGSEKYTRIISPLKPSKLKSAHIFGFDAEWDPRNDSLISFQLAYQRDGEILSKLVEASEADARFIVDEAKGMLREHGIKIKNNPTFYFITHFARGDLGHVKKALETFKFRTVHKAIHAEAILYEIFLEHRRQQVGRTRLRILDLYAFLPESLAEIGKWVGLHKIELGGKLPHKVYKKDPEFFERYAKRDAEICFLAFEKLREAFGGAYGVDILRRKSLQDAAQAAFRVRLRAYADPIKIEHIVRDVHTKRGWVKKPIEKIVYAGPKELREFSARCFWGGRNEAYFGGVKQGDWVNLDVVSLYPSAIMLAPLPLGETKWHHVNENFDPEKRVGFAKVKFEFAKNTGYPCLPVINEWQSKLYFPLKGESWCTLFEFAQALRMGCKVKVLKAWFFKPTKREIDHPLKSFVGELLERKRASKGTPEHELTKLIVNSIYGKLCQRNPEFDECKWLEYHQELGLPIEKTRELYRSWRYRQRFQREQTVGPLWNPQWAALITGKARAIMAQLVEKGAMLCATDGIIVDRDADLRCQALRELKSVGSELELKSEGDLLWVGKDRCYGLFKKGEVVDGAGHGTQMSKDEFKKFIAGCIEQGKLVRESWVKHRIGSLKDELAGKGKMGSGIEQEVRLALMWDGKRELVKNVENIFTEGSPTKPWKEVTRLELDEARQARQRMPETAKREELLAKARRVQKQREEHGTPIAKACEKEGIPRRTYYRLRLRLPRT